MTPASSSSWCPIRIELGGTVLHEFAGGNDSCPIGGLIFDSAGNLYGSAYEDLLGPGDIFELSPNSDGTWAGKVLYVFTGGADGSSATNLVFDTKGNLYATTVYGGAFGWGVVFELSPNLDGTWTQSVLYNFTGGSDGGHSVGGMIFDAAGNLYGTTYWGGSGGCVNRCGTVFKIAPNADGTWTESVLYMFTGHKDGANAQHNLSFDAAGNLYGATLWGDYYQGCENNSCGSVFELTPNADGSWTIHVLHTFTGGKDGGGPFGSLVMDAVGNLYGTAAYGGAHGYGGAFKLAPKPTGGWVEAGISFNGRPSAVPWGGLTFDSSGNLYGTTFGDGSPSLGSVYEITP
jgi:uncharacterized repeat protein (TIGR03803 family)